jgi:ribosomal RNA assembly protein
MQHVKIPQDRIGALIGAGGETLREIERRADVRLDVDSENGSVSIEQQADGDPVTALKGPEVVRAIGRGFNPDDALTLLDDEMRMLDVVDINAVARNKNDLQRQKGRLIGENGRTRELMEELTGATVVIYGSTLGAIGTPKEVDVVREATEMLLDGAPHGTVYSFLEEKHNELKRQGMEYHRFPGSS